MLEWGAAGGRGPSVVVAKQGEYGAALVTREGFFALPAFPLETVVDPTGAGDTFAGGFVGYIAAHPGDALSDELLRRAMAYGTALASFNVEEFGTERVERLTRRGDRRARRRAARDDAVQRHAARARALSGDPGRAAARRGSMRLAASGSSRAGRVVRSATSGHRGRSSG